MDARGLHDGQDSHLLDQRTFARRTWRATAGNLLEMDVIHDHLAGHERLRLV